MKKFSLALLVLALLGGACAIVMRGPAPVWLSAKTATDDGAYYGYGCAEAKIDNATFKRQTADERARVNLAQNLHDELMKTIDDERLVRQAIEAALPKFKIVARHQDQEGNLCSRARLAKSKVEEAVYVVLHPKPGKG